MKREVAALTALAVLLAGCATSSRDVATSYVSPMQYQTYDCDQLGVEAGRLAQRVQQLGGRLDEAAENDKAIMGVGLILFWPALFALGGTKQQEAEYSRLKGEAEAIEQAAIAKKCPGAMTAKPVNVAPPAAPAPTTTGYNSTSTACSQGVPGACGPAK